MKSQLTLLHGWLGHPDDWLPLKTALPELSITCPSIPTSSTWDSTLSELIAATPASSIIGGYSLGARISLGAVIAPQRHYAGLIFMAGNPGIDVTDRGRRAADDKRIVESLRTSTIDFLRTWYQQDLFQPMDSNQLQSLIREKEQLNVSRNIHWNRTLSIAHQPDYRPQLRDLDIPTCLIAGSEDTKYTAIVQDMHAMMPRSELAIIPGVGHMVHRQAPEACASAIRRFLSRFQKGPRPE